MKFNLHKKEKQLGNIGVFYWNTRISACSYGKKPPRWAIKHFDKFTSEITLNSYENSKKSYFTFIWEEKFSRVPRCHSLIGEISARGKIFVPFERKLFNTFLVSGKTTSYERNKIIWWVEIFYRQPGQLLPIWTGL